MLYSLIITNINKELQWFFSSNNSVMLMHIMGMLYLLLPFKFCSFSWPFPDFCVYTKRIVLNTFSFLLLFSFILLRWADKVDSLVVFWYFWDGVVVRWPSELSPARMGLFSVFLPNHILCVTFLSALETSIRIGNPQFSLVWHLKTLCLIDVKLWVGYEIVSFIL